LNERLGGLFQRSETRAQAGLYLGGLISGVERENGWQLAEHMSDEAPWRMQAVLGRGFWDAERARDIRRDYVVDRLGDPSGVLVRDETVLKKGKHSKANARHSSGGWGHPPIQRDGRAD
jgi:SRSO17 transposase